MHSLMIYCQQTFGSVYLKSKTYDQARILNLAQHKTESFIPQDTVTSMAERPLSIFAPSQPLDSFDSLKRLALTRHTCFFGGGRMHSCLSYAVKTITIFPVVSSL